MDARFKAALEHERDGNLDKAARLYRGLLLRSERVPSRAEVYTRLAAIAYQQGDGNKARSLAKRAMAEPGSPAEAAELLELLSSPAARAAEHKQRVATGIVLGLVCLAVVGWFLSK